MNCKCSKCSRERVNVFLTPCSHYMCLECLKKTNNWNCIICSKPLFITSKIQKIDQDDSMIYYDNMYWYDNEVK